MLSDFFILARTAAGELSVAKERLSGDLVWTPPNSFSRFVLYEDSVLRFALYSTSASNALAPGFRLLCRVIGRGDERSLLLSDFFNLGCELEDEVKERRAGKDSCRVVSEGRRTALAWA